MSAADELLLLLVNSGAAVFCAAGVAVNGCSKQVSVLSEAVCSLEVELLLYCGGCSAIS